MLWATLDPVIHVDVTLQIKCTISWQRYSPMSVASFTGVMSAATTQKLFRNDLKNMTKKVKGAESLSNLWDVPSTGRDTLKETVANSFVPDSTAHTSCGVHASTGQSCLGGTRETYTILGRWLKCYG